MGDGEVTELARERDTAKLRLSRPRVRARAAQRVLRLQKMQALPFGSLFAGARW